MFNKFLMVVIYVVFTRFKVKKDIIDAPVGLSVKTGQMSEINSRSRWGMLNSDDVATVSKLPEQPRKIMFVIDRERVRDIQPNLQGVEAYDFVSVHEVDAECCRNIQGRGNRPGVVCVLNEMSITTLRCLSKSTGTHATSGKASRNIPWSCTNDQVLPSSLKSGS